MCRAGLGTLSAQEMTTGRVSHQQISPIKGEIVIYRPSIGPDSLRDALRATLVGSHRESSGESRLNPINRGPAKIPAICVIRPGLNLSFPLLCQETGLCGFLAQRYCERPRLRQVNAP